MNSNNLNKIQSPVGPYSPPEAIEAWLRELAAMTHSDEVEGLIEQARVWLEVQKSYMAIA